MREGNGFSSLVGGAEAASLLLGQGVELLRHFPSHSVVALVGTGAPALWGSKPKCYWLVMMAQLMMLAELLSSSPPPITHTHTPGHAAHLHRSRSCPLHTCVPLGLLGPISCKHLSKKKPFIHPTCSPTAYCSVHNFIVTSSPMILTYH